MNDVMDLCGQWKVFETEYLITENPKGGLRPPSGIPDYDLEYSVIM